MKGLSSATENPHSSIMHQGCPEHEQRCLRGFKKTETVLTRAGKMRAPLYEAIHTANEAIKTSKEILSAEAV